MASRLLAIAASASPTAGKPLTRIAQVPMTFEHGVTKSPMPEINSQYVGS